MGTDPGIVPGPVPKTFLMDPSLLIEHIASGAQSLGQELSEESVQKCARLLCELGRWNSRMNLTAIRDPNDMVKGHVLDSLVVRPLIYGKSLIDIGTGAGFPGLPIAIAEPGLTVELLDSNARKIGFVQHVIGELDISNALAVRSRGAQIRKSSPQRPSTISWRCS